MEMGNSRYGPSFGISSGDIALNTLALATAENGPDWPNPEWSTLSYEDCWKTIVSRMISSIVLLI
jgi:hypothetical protein